MKAKPCPLMRRGVRASNTVLLVGKFLLPEKSRRSLVCLGVDEARHPPKKISGLLKFPLRNNPCLANLYSKGSILASMTNH